MLPDHRPLAGFFFCTEEVGMLVMHLGVSAMVAKVSARWVVEATGKDLTLS